MDFPVQDYYSTITKMSLSAEIGAIKPKLGEKVDSLVSSQAFFDEYKTRLLTALKGPKDSLKILYPEDIFAQMIVARCAACKEIFANPNRLMGQAVARTEMAAIIHDAPTGFENLRAFKREQPNEWSTPFFGSPLGTPFIDYDPQTTIATLTTLPDIEGMSRDEADSLYGRVRSLFMHSFVGWHGGKVIEDSQSTPVHGIGKTLKISFTEGTLIKMNIVSDDLSSSTYLTIVVTSPKLKTTHLK